MESFEDNIEHIPFEDETVQKTGFSFIEQFQKEQLYDAMAKLPERYQKVIQDHFFNQKTIGEIAQEFNVSENRIRQIRDKSLRMLKRELPEKPEWINQPNKPRGY